MTCCASVTISVFVRVLNLILAVPFLTRFHMYGGVALQKLTITRFHPYFRSIVLKHNILTIIGSE